MVCVGGSNVSGVGVGGGGNGGNVTGVRVGVRLGQYFLDERSAALVWVPATLRKVHQLESRLRTLFALPGTFCLMRGSYLLPSTEDIHLLQQDDVVTVVPIANPFPFPFRQWDDIADSTSASIHNTPPTPTPDKDSKKKKRKKQKEAAEDVQLDNSTPKSNPKKNNKENSPPVSTPEIVKKKHKSFDDPGVISAIENIERLHAELVRPEDDGDDEEEVDGLKTKALSLLKDLAQPGVIGVSDGRITKRKRVRIRKSKKNNSSIVSTLSDSESNPPLRNNGLVLLNGKMNSHIRFPTNESTPVTILRNKSCKIDDKPRIIQSIHSCSDTEILNGSKLDDFGEKETVTENHCTLNSIINKLDQYPQMATFPVPNDMIVFKMLKMDAQYTPIVSNYILGKVSSTCANTMLVKFSILDGNEECTIPSGKFDIEDCDDVSKSNNELDIIWSQVIEPRLIHL